LTDIPITEQLAYSTVRIVGIKMNGKEKFGTGFYYQFQVTDDMIMPVIITNKHVIKDTIGIEIVVHISDEKWNRKGTQTFRYEGAHLRAINHPDPLVDLCAIPIALIEYNLANGLKHYRVNATSKQILSEESVKGLQQVENILMVGYPTGLWDAHNNKPIFRKGITATAPADDYNGKKEILIDMACFAGSSGSPVYLYDNSIYTDTKGNISIKSNRLSLLGVLYAGPQYTAKGAIEVVDVPTEHTTVAKSKIPMHLGYIIKASRIIELEPLVKAAAKKEM
jgi:V8-like Glu-specific endopeptidase